MIITTGKCLKKVNVNMFIDDRGVSSARVVELESGFVDYSKFKVI